MKTYSGEIGYFPLIVIGLLMALMFEASGFTHFFKYFLDLIK